MTPPTPKPKDEQAAVALAAQLVTACLYEVDLNAHPATAAAAFGLAAALLRIGGDGITDAFRVAAPQMRGEPGAAYVRRITYEGRVTLEEYELLALAAADTAAASAHAAASGKKGTA